MKSTALHGRLLPVLRLLAAVTLAGPPVHAYGQAAQLPGTGLDVRAAAVFESYEFSDEGATGVGSVSLFSVPLQASLPLGDAFTLGVRTAFGAGSVEDAGGRVIDLSGPTDTEVQLGFRNRGAVSLSLSAIAILPTGNSTHSADEALVSGAVATDLLPFRMSNWGSGGGVGAHASAAQSFGDTGVGFSASYVMGRAFEPVDGAPFSYQPGDHLRVRGAVDHNLGDGSRVTLSLTFDGFSEDQLEDTNLYQAGNRLQVMGSYGFRAGRRSTALLYGGVLHRSEGSELSAGAPITSARNLVLAGGGIRIPTALGVLTPSVDTRVARRDDGLDQGWLAGAGMGIELRLGGQVVTPAVRGRLGELVIQEGLQTDITGFEISVSTRLGG